MIRSLLFTVLVLGCLPQSEGNASGEKAPPAPPATQQAPSPPAPPSGPAVNSGKGRPQTGLQTAKLQVHPPSGAPLDFQVELAIRPQQREKGMMFRTEMGPLEGMLFVMDRTANHRFWMKNTLIPLDMLFIAEDGEVVGIVRNAAPRSLKGRSVGRPSRFILEIGGGESDRLKITEGSWVNLSSIPLGTR